MSFHHSHSDLKIRERVLFIGTQFSILYTSVHPPAGAMSFHHSHKKKSRLVSSSLTLSPPSFITHTLPSLHHSHSPLPPSQESVPSRERGRGRGRGEGGGHGTLWRWVRGQGGGDYKDASRCCLGHSCSLVLPCGVCVHSSS